MLAADATSRADFEAATATAKAAHANLAALTAQIAQASVQVQTAQVNLGYTRIVAPIDGTVVAIVTKQGQTVNANQAAPTIVKIGALQTMTVKAEISEADVIKVSPGQDVYFTILGDPGKRYYAKLRTVEPAPESIETSDTNTSSSTTTATAVYYNGLFEVPNTDGRLRTSMTAQVYVVLGQAKNALTIPASALGPKGKDGGYVVRVMVGKDQIEPRRVKIGINNNVTAQVLSGLSEGDKVVTGDAPKPAAGAAAGGPPGGGRRGPPMGGL
ncbi:MAG: hypothetical protein BGN86_11005 [Caulobacterales bacterium 68-7]|nr:MAG: hypothetical protein BGN86_11005 [Caulobacterales bacterium 68-7]